MPTIWNVNNRYNTNDKKLSSKLTFQAGEKFHGKIASKTSGNEVQIKLSDGWQFSAELQEKDSLDEGKSFKFEVIGYKNGKLLLKTVQDKGGESLENSNNLVNILKKEGLSDSDIDLLKNMREFNIQLTRENITYVKSLLDFSTKIHNNPEEVQKFIDNFLESKNIDVSSEEGVFIRGKLTEFFNEFKYLSSKDILMFIENNIEINKENINSYLKLFNGSETIKGYFDSVLSGLKENNEVNNLNVLENQSELFSSSEIVSKDIGNQLNNSNINKIATNIYDKVGSESEKVSVLNLLKSMMDNEVDVIKRTLNDILSDRMDSFSISEYKDALNNINSEDFINEAKQYIVDGKINKEDLSKIISKIFNKEISITDNEAKKINDVIEYAFKDKERILGDKISNILLTKGIEVSKDDITSIVNTMNKGDNIVLEKSIKDTIISVIGKDINISKEEIDSIINALSVNKNNIGKNVETSLNQDLSNLNNLATKENIKSELLEKLENVKETVKEIIKIVEGSKLNSTKVLDFIKANINEFKLFNSISNEYYYLNVPISNNGYEYPCKLIIKDDRKSGKQIDKNNIKLVVTVDTVNLGGVEGYLTIHNNSMNIELRCDESAVKILDKNKKQLVDGLKTLGLNANIFVKKKVEDITLSTCRSFFDEGSNIVIDRRV